MQVMTQQRSQPLVDDNFVVTKEYRRFAEFCHACRRERYIGLCYGVPGVGKTLSAKNLAKWYLFEKVITEGVHFTGLPPSLVEEVKTCRIALYTSPVANSPALVARQVYGVLYDFSSYVEMAIHFEDEGWLKQPEIDYCQLLIVDEADRLSTSSLEQVRDIYDKGQMGLVLIGMPGLEKRLARYPQLYSRIGFAHEFKILSQAEITFLLERHLHQLGFKLQEGEFADAEALAAMIRITNGNFRLLNRLLTQIKRVMEINQLGYITKEVVETARDCLVIGTI